MLRKVIADNLKGYRKNLQCSQHAIADKSDMEQKDISKIENYVENIGVDKIDQLCKGLGIHPYELVIDPDEISAKDLLGKKCFAKGVILLLYQYYLLFSRIYNEEISKMPYETYGIAIKDQSVPCIKDISTDKAFVEGLVDLCNIHQVSPEHLLDVIENALIEL